MTLRPADEAGPPGASEPGGSAPGWEPAGVHLPVRADATLRRLADRIWSGGSPMRLFRVTEGGEVVLARLRSGEHWRPAGAPEVNLYERLLDAGAVHPVTAVPAITPRRRAAEGAGTAGDRVDDRGITRAGLSLEYVTVVVPVRDDPAGLDDLLTGLFAPLVGSADRDRGVGVPEVVVVDDGSLDPVAPARVAEAHAAAVVRHDTARGPAAARNTGLRMVHTPLVAFIDADVRCDVGWLTVLPAHFGDLAEHTRRDEATRKVDCRTAGPTGRPNRNVVAVAPRVRSTSGDGIRLGYERRHGPLDLGTEPARVGPGSRVTYVPTAALLARTDAVRAVGGFDESLRFGEDVDLVWRLVARGGAVRYDPTAEVEHRARPDIVSWMRQRFDYGTAAGALERRHPGSAAPAVMSPWSAAGWSLVAAGYLMPAAAVVGYSLRALDRELVGVPTAAVLRVGAEGHLVAGRQLLRAAIRPWWPLFVIASVRSRSARIALGAAVVLRVVSTSGPLADRLLGLLDDGCYSAGVWVGAARARRIGPLLVRSARSRARRAAQA